MEKVIGFIGGGNMCGAIIGGMCGAGLAAGGDIWVSDRFQPGLDRLRERYGVNVTADNRETARRADILILSVKPNVYDEVIAEIRDDLRPDALVISIAAGQSITAVERRFARPVKVARVMPNTPALVGEGMSAVCANTSVSPAERETVHAIFGGFGRVEDVPERLFDAVTAASGSSPAYVYLFIEAMADAVVAAGMPRAQAYTFCAQAVLGSAKMVLETGRHPGELKDMVCSPGGTTIDAVVALEESGLRGAVTRAVAACVAKSKAMGE